MANPTTNYGFVLPTPTDLVTDLPADFEVALQGVDTQMLTNANAAIAKSIVDAKGDIIAATAADTVSRLAVGANDTVLTADSSTATGLKWAAPGGAGLNWTLLNSGGTALSGSSVSITGISAKDNLMIFISGASPAASSTIEIRMTINNDSTGGNYESYGNRYSFTSSYDPNIQLQVDETNAGAWPYWTINRFSNAAGGSASAMISLSGCNSAGRKIGISQSGNSMGGGTDNQAKMMGVLYAGTSTVSSLQFFLNSSTFDAGRVWVYGA
jgi:hypothetical protein